MANSFRLSFSPLLRAFPDTHGVRFPSPQLFPRLNFFAQAAFTSPGRPTLISALIHGWNRLVKYSPTTIANLFPDSPSAATKGIGLSSPSTISGLFSSLAGKKTASASASSTASASASASTKPSPTKAPKHSAPQSSSQAPTSTGLVSPTNTSSPSADKSAFSTFLQNKPALYGAIAGAVVVLILLLAFLTHCIRRRNRRRQRKLDQEMDASFRQTVSQAAASRAPPSFAPTPRTMNLNRVDSTFSDASGSHGTYMQPPLPVASQQQPYYNYNYGPPPPPAPAPQRQPSDDWDSARGSAVVGVAVRGMRAEPQFIQHPQRAPAQLPRPPGASAWPQPQPQTRLAPTQAQAQTVPTLYLSQHYMLSPLPADAAAAPQMMSPTEMPVTPTSFPNPFDSEPPPPQGEPQERSPVSPAPSLPNPYSAME
ncbi:hypothetical protein K438DRAFT_1928017 [Mycena galopus ATCC 62051]|nr:hypothetical protein K438DRAFT_1928017 [Mycena galopus ATCC 62051]